MSRHKNSKEHNKVYRDKNRETLREKDRERYNNLSPEEKQKRIERARKSYLKNKDVVLARSRERHLKIKYNLTSQDYLEMVNKQKNLCAICGKPEHRLLKTGDIKPLSVDHNHTTGVVRELLCKDCNALLGFANEDINILLESSKSSLAGSERPMKTTPSSSMMRCSANTGY